MTLDVDVGLERGGFALGARFRAPSTGVTAVFGPSGAGKTLLLRTIAGLERGARGRVALDDEVWLDRDVFVPPHQRQVGYVFQEASLFGHLSVRENLVYGWKRVPSGRRRLELDRVVELLEIGTLLDRRPETLSGGERQRAALGRALLTSPRLVLMDEPLAALDRNSRSRILPYLERVFAVLEVPVLYVSHAADEVARLADRMVLLEAGSVQATGGVGEILTRLDLPLARSAEAEAVLEARVARHDSEFGLTSLECGTGELTVARLSVDAGAQVRVRVLARDVSLALDRPGRSSILNVLPATVVEVASGEGGAATVLLEAAGDRLLARITAMSASRLGLEPGLRVYAQIKSVAVLV